MIFGTSMALTTSPLTLYLTRLLVHCHLLTWLSWPLTSLSWTFSTSHHYSSPDTCSNTYLSLFLKKPFSAMFLPGRRNPSYLNIPVLLFWSTTFTITSRHCAHSKAYLGTFFSGLICDYLLLLGYMPVYHVGIPRSIVPVHFQQSNIRFYHIHIDLVGPWPVSHGFTYVLTCKRRFSRQPEAIPLVDISTESLARALHPRADFSLRSTLQNHDRQWMLIWNLFLSWAFEIFGVQHIYTTSYHLSASRMVEQFHRQLKAAIRAASDPYRWSDFSPLFCWLADRLSSCMALLLYF